MQQTIDLNRVADDAKFNRFHLTVLLWCAAVIVFDGYDLAVVGVALPLIMKDMGVDATQAGFMASSALFGMMFGNIVFGGLADRYGRKLSISICIVIFSVFTALAGMVKDPVSFSVVRFVAGLGIGGVMPIVVAQMTDYSPLRMRAAFVALSFSGYSIGGMLAAILGKSLIAAYGWQTVFLAAATPILLLPLLWLQMPESFGFLLKKGRTAEIQRIVARLQPGYVPQAGDQFVLASATGGGKSIQRSAMSQVFSDGRWFSTLMFWSTCFMTLFIVYALNSWLTKLMAQAGYSLGSALTFVLVLNLGGLHRLDLRGLGGRPNQSQNRDGHHVYLRGYFHCIDGLQAADRCVVCGGVRRGRMHHRNAKHDTGLLRAVLSHHRALYGRGPDAGHGPHRRHSVDHLHRHDRQYEPLAGEQLHRDCHTGCCRCAEHFAGAERALGSGSQQQAEHCRDSMID